MKYRAPEGVTALFCAGETILPDEAGIFDAGEELAAELAAHGCAVEAESGALGERPTRVRSGKAA
ncbi:MAG TPA: hypothetical protein VMU18_06060 [Rhodoblastus sp.]|nr:hypothetical protein [Rhodoblastus sp.]